MSETQLNEKDLPWPTPSLGGFGSCFQDVWSEQDTVKQERLAMAYSLPWRVRILPTNCISFQPFLCERVDV